MSSGEAGREEMFGQTIDILKFSFPLLPSVHFLSPVLVFLGSFTTRKANVGSLCIVLLFPQIERNGEKEREKGKEERKEPNRRGVDIDQKGEKSEVVNFGTQCMLALRMPSTSLPHRNKSSPLPPSLTLSLSTPKLVPRSTPFL